MFNARITLALPLSAVLVFGPTIAAHHAPQSQSQPQPPSHQSADMQSFKGCVERDPSARGQIGASQQTGAEQTALLRTASRTSSSTRAGERPQQTARPATGSSAAPSGTRTDGSAYRDGKDGDAGTYRLVAAAQSSFELVTFIGQQVEVRGTVSPQPVPRDRVDQAARTPQGQPTTVDPPSTDFDDNHKALTVTSITKISDSCDSLN